MTPRLSSALVQQTVVNGVAGVSFDKVMSGCDDNHSELTLSRLPTNSVTAL